MRHHAALLLAARVEVGDVRRFPVTPDHLAGQLAVVATQGDVLACFVSWKARPRLWHQAKHRQAGSRVAPRNDLSDLGFGHNLRLLGCYAGKLLGAFRGHAVRRSSPNSVTT